MIILKNISYLLIVFLLMSNSYGLRNAKNFKLLVLLDKSYTSTYGTSKFLTISKYLSEKDSMVELGKTFFANNKYSFEITKPNDTKYFLLKDDKNYVIAEVYVADEDEITTTVSNENNSIWQKDIKKARYPGNNCVYANLYPDVLKLDKRIREDAKIFLNEFQIKEYVHEVFEAAINERLKIELKENPVSQDFLDNVLKPQLELLKIYMENNLRIKQAIQPYNGETIFELLKGLDPDWWNRNYIMNSNLQDAINKYFEKHTFQNFSGYCYAILDFFKFSSKKLITTVLFYSLDAYVHQKTEFNKADSIFIDSLVQAKLIENSLVQKIVPQLAPEIVLSNEYLSLLTLLDSAGTEISLSQIFVDKSKSYFVDFWAGWCRPCIDHLPESIRLGNTGNPLLEVLFFNMDRTQIAYRDAVQKYKVPLSHCFRFNYEEANMLRLQQIKADPSIPAYRLFYYSNGKWHSKTISGAEDPVLRQFVLKSPS